MKKDSEGKLKDSTIYNIYFIFYQTSKRVSKKDQAVLGENI